MPLGNVTSSFGVSGKASSIINACLSYFEFLVSRLSSREHAVVNNDTDVKIET